MKQLVLATAGVLLLFGVACNKNEKTDSTPQKSEGSETTIIRVNMDDVVSKVTFTDENSTLKTAWEETDQLRVISGDKSAVYSISRILSPRVAEFTGPAVEGSSYSVLYPGTYSSVEEAEADMASPAQNGNGSTAHLRLRALLTGVNEYQNISFYSDWAQSHGGSLKMSAAVKVMGKLPDGVATLKELSLNIGGKVFTLPLSHVDVSSAAQVLTAYMMLPWQDILIPDGTKVKICATGTDDKEYGTTLTVSGNKNVMMGKLSIFGSPETRLNGESTETGSNGTLPDFDSNPIVE